LGVQRMNFSCSSSNLPSSTVLFVILFLYCIVGV
jgi:hypothetical protein